MPFQMIRDDITKVHCDAIVNAANSSLLGGGGVDGAIHRAAGPQLLEECRTLGGCACGEAKITRGYKLPAKYVIHTVGPVYRDGSHGEKELLHACYANSLKLAKEYLCESIAFPLISAGVYGYPRNEAIRVAIDAISEFLSNEEMDVRLVIFDRASLAEGEKIFPNIRKYIDDHYVDAHPEYTRRRERRRENNAVCMNSMPFSDEETLEDTVVVESIVSSRPKEQRSESLQDHLQLIDESFSEMLLRKIDECGMSDSECYHRANIDRKLFSKIRSDIHYRPKKTTVLAFAIALSLSLEETKDMLQKAGYALSHSNYFDLIIEYFIANKNYDIYEINEALFEFDQPLLGV